MHYKAQTILITFNDEHELDCYITSVTTMSPRIES